RVCSRPSTYTERPFFRYSAAISASRCHSTTVCHSVRSCHSPFLSLKRSLVATVMVATAVPLPVCFNSGSLPRFPTRMTLLTLFAMPLPLLSFCGQMPILIFSKLKHILLYVAPRAGHAWRTGLAAQSQSPQNRNLKIGTSKLKQRIVGRFKSGERGIVRHEPHCRQDRNRHT